MCLIMMTFVLVVVLMGIFKTGEEHDRYVSATKPDENAIYVNASPIGTTTNTTAATTAPKAETTTITPAETTNAPAAETEKKALYYVTISGESIVLLDEYGEYLKTLHQNALFLPKEDVVALRTGLEIFSRDELQMLLEDLS